jgi:hypothetical protein
LKLKVGVARRGQANEMLRGVLERAVLGEGDALVLPEAMVVEDGYVG